MDTSPAAVFTLSGANESWTMKYIVFAFTAQGYFLTLFLNVTLIAVIGLEKELHQPMYIFLCNLCVNGLYGTLGFYPKFMSDLLSDSHVVSYNGCLLQSFIIFSYALCELTNLTVMAVDRYVAICKPLHYHSTVTRVRAGKMLVFVWMLPCCSVVLSILITTKMSFCGGTVQHNTLYCKLTISTCREQLLKFVFNGISTSFYLSMALFVVYSYGKIFFACRKSRQNQSKFVQTCVPHLITYLHYIFVVLCDSFSIRLSGTDLPQWFQNFMSVAFLVTPPVLNPLIYGMNLTPIRTKIRKMLQIRQENCVFSDSSKE
ncbi:olfactory receptor 13D1-like [Scleropages formosus]|uniref:Olfactory receptor 13D1-like n=1 Tax=Scleropages formosus TaxID=113540 RepID=A0A0P7VJM1_SCLFO|nr:olfactory receptor 13D1-like [Scleropages formosus]